MEYYQKNIVQTHNIFQNQPSPRQSFGICQIDEKELFINGGHDNQKQYDDSYLFDVEKKQFQLQIIKDQVSGHKIVKFPGNSKFLLSFGGFDDNDYQDQLKLIDLQQQTVKKLKQMDSLQEIVVLDKRVSRLDSLIFSQQEKQVIPQSRKDHTLNFVPSLNSIVLLGGWNGIQQQIYIVFIMYYKLYSINNLIYDLVYFQIENDYLLQSQLLSIFKMQLRLNNKLAQQLIKVIERHHQSFENIFNNFKSQSHLMDHIYLIDQK